MSIVLTFAVFGTWLLLAVALSSIGVLFFHRLGGVESSWEHAYYGVWAGLALLTLALLAWHVFLPMDHVAFIVFGAAAGLALLTERRWFATLLRVRRDRVLVAALAGVGLWIANHALGSPGMDDYNYEFQAIRWIHDYPLVPGLANLHGRLGFNNAHHLLGALLSTGFWQGRVHHIVNGFVVALSLAYVLYAIRQTREGRDEDRAQWTFAALLAAPGVGLVVFGVFGPALSTLKADVFVGAGLALLSCLYAQSAVSEPGTHRFTTTSATTVLLAGLLFSVKINAAVFSLVVAGAVMLRVAANMTRGLRGRGLLIASALAGAALTVATMLRGIGLSGYPLYPLELFGLPVDWRVPGAQARLERLYVKAFAQLRPTYDFEVLDNWDWLLPWARSVVLTEEFGVVLPIVMTLVLGVALFRQKVRGRSGVRAYCVLMAASAAALGIWFTQAPAARFASIYFWILFGSVAALVTQGHRRERTSSVWLVTTALIVGPAAWMLLSYLGVPNHDRLGVMLVVEFGVVWALAFQALSGRSAAVAVLCVVLGVSQIGERALAHILSGRPAEAAAMFWYDVDRLDDAGATDYTARQTRSGLTVYEAKASRYDTPLPNTRYFNRFLELRDPARLDGGFRNAAPNPAIEYGYSVDYVMQPNGGIEIVRPQQ